MSFINNLWLAASSAYIAFRRVFEDPANAHTQGSPQSQISDYNLLWAYYSGAMFDRGIQGLAAWAAYKNFYNLYRDIRLIYNPVRRLCEFYAGQIYPGVLSEDGSMLPEGTALAIPFAKDTPEDVKVAISQFWDWSNFQSQKSVIPRWGAALGSVLIELCDDVEAGRIVSEPVWPGHVVELELDGQGNVKRYVLEYQVREPASPIPGRTNPNATYYTYRREVDIESFRFYKNGSPFDYDGQGAVRPNPWGWVPAEWVKHTDVGGDRGSAAIAGSLGKIDELNNLASQIHDQIRKVIGAPILIAAGKGGEGLSTLFNNPKRSPTDDPNSGLVNPNPAGESEKLLMLKGPAGTTVEHLAGVLPLADCYTYIQGVITDLEADHPELNFYRKLAEMSTVTGPAARQLSGDVQSKVWDAAANYDRALISLFKKAVAMGGFRANEGKGGWAVRTPQQQKFLPFNLDSLKTGALELAIMPRPLLPATKKEQADEHAAEAQAVNTYVTAGVPIKLSLEKVAGWSEEELAELDQQKEAADQKALERQQTLMKMQPQPQPQPGQDNNSGGGSDDQQPGKGNGNPFSKANNDKSPDQNQKGEND